WRYITELYGMQNVVAFDVSRLASSPNYQGSGPKILKVTLATPEMASMAINVWYHSRRLGPPEVRLRPFLQAVQTTGTVESDLAFPTIDQPSVQTLVSKNVGRPALFVPVKHSEPTS
ncbi:unnamed protein product, partial [Dicrocoelium dendriticum]